MIRNRLRDYIQSIHLENIVFHLFYLLVFFYNLDRGLYSYSGYHYAIPHFPHLIIKWIPRESLPSLMPIIAIAYSLLALSLTLNPWIKIVRFLLFLLHLILYGYLSSFGHPANDFYGITFVLITFVFLRGPNAKEHNASILTMAQLTSVMSYAMAGLWKLRNIPQIGLTHLKQNLGNIIAYEHFQRGYKLNTINKYFIKNDWITGPMFMFTILIQTLSPLGAIFKRTKLLTGILLTVFHLLSELIVHIKFRPQMYLVILLLVIHPLIEEYKSKKVD